MKSVREVEKILKNFKNDIKQNYKAEVVGIFGSFARGEQKSDSDVDILVKFHKDATLFDFMRLSMFLQEKIGIDVDIVPQDAIREELRERIVKEAIFI